MRLDRLSLDGPADHAHQRRARHKKGRHRPGLASWAWAWGFKGLGGVDDDSGAGIYRVYRPQQGVDPLPTLPPTFPSYFVLRTLNFTFAGGGGGDPWSVDDHDTCSSLSAPSILIVHYHLPLTVFQHFPSFHTDAMPPSSSNLQEFDETRFAQGLSTARLDQARMSSGSSLTSRQSRPTLGPS